MQRDDALEMEKLMIAEWRGDICRRDALERGPAPLSSRGECHVPSVSGASWMCVMGVCLHRLKGAGLKELAAHQSGLETLLNGRRLNRQQPQKETLSKQGEAPENTAAIAAAPHPPGSFLFERRLTFNTRKCEVSCHPSPPWGNFWPRRR